MEKTKEVGINIPNERELKKFNNDWNKALFQINKILTLGADGKWHWTVPINIIEYIK